MLPMMNAEAGLYGRLGAGFAAEGDASAASRGGGVSPQICIPSPCLRLPSGRFCISLPVVGRRCVNIPNLGSWRIRCCTHFGWPPVRCRPERC